MIQPDLRCLGDPGVGLGFVFPSLRDRGVLAGFARLLPEQETGEDDGHGSGRSDSLGGGHLAQQTNGAYLAVLEIPPELLLDSFHTAFEMGRRAGVHGDQGQGGEVADHLVDLRVNREAVERRHVDGEAGRLAPTRQHLPVGRQQEGGGSDRPARRAGFERAPRLAIERGAPAMEPWLVERGGITGQRQLGSRRQVLEPSAPVRQRFLIGGGSGEGDLSEHVIPERQLEGWQIEIGLAVESLQIPLQDLKAPDVAQEDVEAEVQQGALLRGVRHVHLEEGPDIRWAHLV